MEKYKINIPKEFSDKLGGRWIRLGPHSGEEFYNDYLKPRFEEAIENNEQLHIYLDGAKGYGSSFLDQSFGELDRNFKKVPESIIFHTEFFERNVSYIKDEIWSKK